MKSIKAKLGVKATDVRYYGVYVDETQTNKGPLVKGSAQHSDFLDTVLIVDNERFHSLTPVRCVDESKRSTRDVGATGR